MTTGGSRLQPGPTMSCPGSVTLCRICRPTDSVGHHGTSLFLVSLRKEAKVWSREKPSEHREAAAAIPQAERAEGAGPEQG